jgi:hypothetical protein
MLKALSLGLAMLALAACTPGGGSLASLMGSHPPAAADMPAPDGATKLAPRLAGKPRLFVVSPDHQRAAYVTETQNSPLRVVTFGGSDVQLADPKADITDLHWSADGGALIYQTGVWDPTSWHFTAYRLMRVRVAGGEPEQLLESKANMMTGYGGSRVFYTTARDDGQFSPLQVLSLDGGAATTLDATPNGPFWVAPDGNSVAWPASPVGLQVVAVASGQQRVVELGNAGNMAWLDNDRLLTTDREGQGGVLRLGKRTGEILPTVPIQGPDAFAAGKAGATHLLSPGGKWLLGIGSGSDPGAPVVSIETGKASYTCSFAWRAWLDDQTLLAISGSDVYSMPVAKAIDVVSIR